MKYAQFAKDMQELDRHTIEDLGVPSLVLMERAALAVADAVLELLGRDAYQESGDPWEKQGAPCPGTGRDLCRMTAPVIAVCGTGNNGGDGAAAARILKNRGVPARIVLIGNPEKLSADMAKELALAESFGVPIERGSQSLAHPSPVLANASPDGSLFTEGSGTRLVHGPAGAKESENPAVSRDRAFPPFGAEGSPIYIDALFGIGLAREVGGDFAEAIRIMNAKNRGIVAADIPSGILADTGQVLGTAVRADITVTMQRGKPGLFLDPGRQYAGEVRIVDIGILAPREIPLGADLKDGASGESRGESSEESPEEKSFEDSQGESSEGSPGEKSSESVSSYYIGEQRASAFQPPRPIRLLETSDLARILPARDPSGNKGTFGKVLLIAGSENMAGAAILSARAALMAGAGMVKILTPSCNRSILQTAVPEALLVTCTPENYRLRLVESLSFGNVIAAGPGLGTDPIARGILRILLKKVPGLSQKPALVLDADALNGVSSERLTEWIPKGTFLTPHIVEMSRLSGIPAKEIIKDRLSAAEDFSSLHDVRLLLKDARTVIAGDGELFINTSGTDGMAAAGSGDVLTGVLAGLLAQGADPSLAGPAAAFLHGLAGEKAARALGRRSMTAGDICRFMPEAFREALGEDF